MKLVRARPKAVGDLPEWAKCCAGALEAIAAMPETLIDISITNKLYDPRCKFCGKSQGKVHLGVLTGTIYTQLDLLDLDEGPVLP